MINAALVQLIKLSKASNFMELTFKWKWEDRYQIIARKQAMCHLGTNAMRSTVRSIPKYFVAIINGIIFFISFSHNLLLVYRNATDFCTLISYPTTLLNKLIRSNRFLLESLGFSLYEIMSSTNRDNFTSFCPVLIPFISFSCLIALARTSVLC